jgi:hypothetical protein
MRALALAVGLSVLLGGYSRAQSKVQGYVFNDQNGNGVRDRKEPGIAGVSVSNGREVSVTDGNGRYELPIGNDHIVFVSKPSGYQVKINELNQPQYYYIHKPNGSPEMKFKGVAPTGNLPASVDFPLTPREEKDEFTALIFGDPQPYTEQELDYFARGIVKEVEGVENVQFGLSLGDIVGDDLSLHKPYLQKMKKIGVPWYNLMGNHDMNYDAVADSLADETFESNFGPANYSFNYGQAHFIVLDDILYPDPRDGQGYWGGFRPDQLAFLENDLKHVSKDKLIVLAFHIPILNAGVGFRAEDRQRLFDLLKDYPNVLAMSAHTHIQRQNFYTAKDGWQGAKPFHEFNSGTPSGNWYTGEFTKAGVPAGTMADGTPRGYSFLRIKGNQYVIDYKVAEMPASHQIRIYAPRVIPTPGRGSYGFYANFYMGHEGNSVEYRIDGGEWKKMTHTVEPDPYYLSLLFRWDQTETLFAGRKPGSPLPSTHLWKAGIPTNLVEGRHTLEVRAVDMFGRTFVETKHFWAEKSK